MAGPIGDLQLLRTLIQQIDDIPYVASPTGELLFFGDQCERYGYGAAEVMARGVMAYIHPDDRERVGMELARGIETGEVFPTEFRIVAADGAVHWLEDHGRVIRDADGQVAGLAGVLRDITARKLADAALRARDERFRNIAAQSFNAIFETDREGRVIYASPAMERITGFAAGEGPREYNTHVHPADREMVSAAFGRVVRGEVVELFTARIVRRDGTEGIVEINAAPVWSGGEVTGVLGVARDVTARRALEERLAQIDKLEAIGDVAGGVAHDFNNILMGILGQAELLLLRAEPGDPEHEAARLIREGSASAADLARQLLDLARRDKPRSEPVDVHRLIDDVAALVSHSGDRRVPIVRRLDAAAPDVFGDPTQLRQVVLNLLVNARSAVEESGTITVTSRIAELDRERDAAPGELSPGRFLVVTVRDDGVGIDERVLPRIFEPYFTTRADGGGAGMGLATVYRIVRNHGGAVRVSSAPGQGSTFEVYLPLTADRP